MNKHDNSLKVLEIQLLNLIPDLPIYNFIFPDIPIPDWSLQNLYVKIGSVPSSPFGSDVLDIDGSTYFYPVNPNL